MKSLTGKFASARGWALLLTLFLGAGLFVVACGDEEVPTPTTPAPTPPAPTPAPAPAPPPPEPDPAPEPPATPVGLRIAASGVDFIEWSWNAVEGVSGYDVQYSANEAFTDEDETIARTAEEISYRREGLEAGVSAFLRVRAAAGTGEERVTSDWSTHVTGMTAEPEPELPAAPANLRLKERGSNFIEWEWDEVSGAAGYESEFSADGVSFTALQPHAGVSNTSRTVSNLAAEAAGHLRVRSYTGSGTGADTVRGDWSASDRQTTEEAPPAVPLATPTGLDATDESDDAIALEWTRVRNADAYEVGQREPGGSWGDASCGGADNVVQDEECVASGLSEGTDYDFRVRAVPADDDSAHTTSGWSDVEEARTSGTVAPEPITPTSGGMGDLNVRWESTASGITWIWDRVAGATYDFIATDEDEYDDAENPCENAAYATGTEDSSATSATLDLTEGGDVALLCVRTTNEDNPSENLSFAWAVTPPAPSTVGTATEKDADKDAVDDTTTGLTWETFQVKAGFDYEWRAAADPKRQDDITGETDIQPVCGDTKLVIETGDSDEDYQVDEIRLTKGLKAHTGYLLCTRYGNSAGTSDWTAPASNVEALTRPAIPPGPTVDRTRTDEGTENATVAWQITVRNSTDVPRLPAEFNAKTLNYREKWADSDDDDKVKTTKAPSPADCEDGRGSQEQFTLSSPLAGANKKTNSNGVVFISGEFSRPAYPGETEDDLDDTRVHLCVQASNTTGAGPWRLSSQHTVNQKPKPE